jgi:plasmid stabilization system protein ParE
MSRYVLTDEAQDDLMQIRDYVLQAGGARVARYVVGSVVAGFRSLAKTAGQGHRREDLTRREELRFWPVFSYMIVYRIDRKPLTVIAILHARRDLEQLLKER